MSGFAVNHEELRQAGRQISGHGNDVQGVQGEITGAEVPAKAWGLLGLDLGLYPAYLAMLSDLENHLQQMGAHLDKTGNALVSVAKAYQDVEESVARALKDIAGGLPGAEA